MRRGGLLGGSTVRREIALMRRAFHEAGDVLGDHIRWIADSHLDGCASRVVINCP